MGKSYRPYYPDEDLLLPPSLRDWLPEKHVAYFVSDVVDHLDLSAMDAVYGNEKRGQPPYDPQMMTKVLVYGYCVGVFSSRRIERRLVEDIAFRVLGAGNQPNFRTISDFRKIHLKTLEGLFEQVLKIALEAGAMKVGRVAVDGTKVKANASKHKAMSYDRMKEKEKDLKAEVKQLLEQAEAADAEEDAAYGKDQRGDELPAELERRETRIKKIREAKRALEARAREKAAAEGADPTETKPKEKDQYNFTDPESRIMKGADGFVQAYNAQAAVEPDLQLIVGQTLRRPTTKSSCCRWWKSWNSRAGRGRKRFSPTADMARRKTWKDWIQRRTRNAASMDTSPRNGSRMASTRNPARAVRCRRGPRAWIACDAS